MFLWHMSGASPFALRHRELMRHAAASQLCVALARASLWLLLSGDFFAKSCGVSSVFLCVVVL